MSKLIILQGPPACGKSTWVKEYLGSITAEDRAQVVVVSRDEIRKSTGTYWVPSREDYITELEDAAMHNAFHHGLTVINDATNLNPKTVAHLKDIAAQHDVEVVFVPLYIPFKEAVARDKKRGEEGGLEVTEKVIKGFYQRYFPERLTDELYNDHRVLEPVQQMKEDAIICDLDGTVALHTSGRNPFDYERCGEDTPCWPMVHTLRRLADGGTNIIFVSGRKDVGGCREKTRGWLNLNVMGTRPFDLILREPGDNRHGDIFKKEVYETQIKGKYNIIHVFEDSTKCVKMYRELGLQCSQVYDFNMDLDNDYGKKNLQTEA